MNCSAETGLLGEGQHPHARPSQHLLLLRHLDDLDPVGFEMPERRPAERRIHLPGGHRLDNGDTTVGVVA